MSKKILDLARDQQEEIAKEAGKRWAEDDDEEEQQGEPYVSPVGTSTEGGLTG